MPDLDRIYIENLYKNTSSDQQNKNKQDDLGDIGKNLREYGLRDNNNQPDEKAENFIRSAGLIAK